MKKITVPRAEMMAEAQKAKSEHREIKIFEAENPHHGRILRTMPSDEGHVILIMR